MTCLWLGVSFAPELPHAFLLYRASAVPWVFYRTKLSMLVLSFFFQARHISNVLLFAAVGTLTPAGICVARLYSLISSFFWFFCVFWNSCHFLLVTGGLSGGSQICHLGSWKRAPCKFPYLPVTRDTACQSSLLTEQGVAPCSGLSKTVRGVMHYFPERCSCVGCP